MSTSRRSEDTRNLGLTSTSFKQDPMIEKKNKKIERERERPKKKGNVSSFLKGSIMMLGGARSSPRPSVVDNVSKN